MNRLVIIGNGFDLAHGLPTGYCDFIDWYWNGVIDKLLEQKVDGAIFDDDFVSIRFAFKNDSLSDASYGAVEISNFATLFEFINKYSEPHLPSQARNFNRCVLEFHNTFLQKISERSSIQNWVDIENEYYLLLKDCLDDPDNYKVKRLNEEFEQIKHLLEEYLNTSVVERYDFAILNNDFGKILKILSVEPLYLENEPKHDYFKEFSKDDYKALIDFDRQLVDSYKNRTLHQDFNSGKIDQQNLILNFNYTPVIEKYVAEARNGSHLHRHIAFGETWQIQIHGKLSDNSNPINFGFGDEMDDSYKLLEKKNDNTYLMNIKSFQYFQNSNYKRTLDFIESGKFQVYIMGHSCGLSDRILLNTIFEHENCRSIKVFYHERDGKDNYTDIVQNISRHFNKKKMMRDKIVNKSLCQPLPQDVRFDEKGSYRSNLLKSYGTYPKY